MHKTRLPIENNSASHYYHHWRSFLTIIQDMEHQELEIQRLPTALLGKDGTPETGQRQEMERDIPAVEAGSDRSKIRVVAILTALFVGALFSFLRLSAPKQGTFQSCSSFVT